MLFCRKKRKGFTLLELVIVVIIIGILIALAIPNFIRAVERSRWHAAASILSTIRSAQLRYYAQYRAYSSSMTNLDMTIANTPDWTVNDPAGSSGEVASVTYNPTSETFTMADDATVTPALSTYVP
jgi:prepilin-type N-terminal cleavage/methylation domain-containing protein